MTPAELIIKSALNIPEPTKKLNRREFGQMLRMNRNALYGLQKGGKLIAPIEPEVGHKYWSMYEAQAYLIASASGFSFKDLTEALYFARLQCAENLLQAFAQGDERDD